MVAVLVMLGLVVVPAARSEAAVAPPAAVHVSSLTDHHIWVQYSVPDKTGIIARITRGYTPAANPNAGYGMAYWPNEVRSGTGGGVLTANTVYTVAIWAVSISGPRTLSARRTVTARTRVDVTPPPDLLTPYAPSPSVGPSGHAQVQLAWSRSTVEDDVVGTRIVRNTKLTTTGGTVLFLSGSGESFLDTAPPITRNPSAPPTVVHYWLVSRDRAGHYSTHYKRLDVVVADRTISGTRRSGSTFITVYCCPARTGTSGTRRNVAYTFVPTGSPFTVHVPPGLYLVCAETSGHMQRTCFGQRSNATVYSFAWTPGVGSDPAPTIDLYGHPSVSGLNF